jgi:CBS domain-containing protein
MTVAELMRQGVRTVSAQASVTEAIRRLVDGHVSALPVLDESQAPVGVLTTKDVLRAEADREPSGARRWLFEATHVHEIMSPWPPPITPEADVHEAARTMLYLDVQRLFVVDGRRLVGVISQTDIVDAVAAAKI